MRWIQLKNMTTKRDLCKISIYCLEFLFLIFRKSFYHFINNNKQHTQSFSYLKCRRWFLTKLLKTQNKRFFSSLIYWFNLHQTSKNIDKIAKWLKLARNAQSRWVVIESLNSCSRWLSAHEPLRIIRAFFML